MYENGQLCKGYFAKKIHKRKMQQRTAKVFGNASYEQFLIEQERRNKQHENRFGEPFKESGRSHEWFERYWRYYSRYCFYDGFEHRQQIRRERHKKIDLDEVMPD